MSEQEGRMEPDLIELTGEEGKTLTMEVVDYFFYNGEEYAIIAEYKGEDPDPEEPRDCFVMKVISFTENGEEMETFEPISDEALENRLLEIANTRLNGDEADDEEV